MSAVTVESLTGTPACELAREPRHEAHGGPSGPTSMASQREREEGTNMHRAAAEGEVKMLAALVSCGADVNCQNAQGDSPLHVAASNEQVEACRVLAALGADALLRNAKQRTPRMQPGLMSAEVQEVLLEAEEISKTRKAERQSRLWDDKMKATQTASACQLGCL